MKSKTSMSSRLITAAKRFVLVFTLIVVVAVPATASAALNHTATTAHLSMPLDGVGDSPLVP